MQKIELIKSKYIPSEQWTRKERLQVIAEIAGSMRVDIIVPGHIEILRDAIERIDIIATMPPRFLENNREKLLNGQNTLWLG